MAKTKWTMKKKKKTKPLKDITSPLKDVEIPKEKKKNDANLVEGKEKEANPVEDKESEMETNTNEENETEERVEDEANEANTVQSDAEEEEEERSEEEEEERSEEEKEEEANKDDVEVNEENSGKENEKERSEEEENEEEEANLDENNPPAANVQSNDGGREEGGRAEGGFDEEEPAAIKPLGMYFPPSEYRKKIKISTRCFIADVLKTLGELQPPMTPFKRSEMKGFPLAKINKALGETTTLTLQDIENILACTDEEKTLLGRITEPEDIRDKDDTIVESWMKCLDRGYVVRFEDMFQEDVAARQDPPPQIGNETEATNEAGGNTVKLDELVQVINSFKESIEGRLTKIEEKVGEFDSRLAASEGFVQELLDGRNVDDMEDEQGISKRSRNKTKDISSRAKKKSKKN
ncbi:hypothetical protein Bca52824_033248 [Brassica carinata]|uniref:DUF287 domain-containing protein n=1 Tax=Brassica carinata TaxID=52824 RepID=A0A8X7SDZ3_BRACI|nr:hypothetical protein Bca52824_033248 [Brassica carinata]